MGKFPVKKCVVNPWGRKSGLTQKVVVYFPLIPHFSSKILEFGVGV